MASLSQSLHGQRRNFRFEEGRGRTLKFLEKVIRKSDRGFDEGLLAHAVVLL